VDGLHTGGAAGPDIGDFHRWPRRPPSICANTRWAITAKAADTTAGTTGTETTLEQGVGVRMAKGKALIKCP
jgi:hypothetical protein